MKISQKMRDFKLEYHSSTLRNLISYTLQRHQARRPRSLLILVSCSSQQFETNLINKVKIQTDKSNFLQFKKRIRIHQVNVQLLSSALAVLLEKAHKRMMILRNKRICISQEDILQDKREISKQLLSYIHKLLISNQCS